MKCSNVRIVLRQETLMNRQFFVCAGFVVVGVLTSICLGQDEPATPAVPAAPASPAGLPGPLHALPAPHAVDLDYYIPNFDFGRSPSFFAISDPEWAKVEKLKDELGDAQDEKQKAGLTDKLKTAVDKCFEADMKGREAELAKLQQRLDKLKSQLDRRRKAKDEIVQLEVKVLANEAAGLGFSTSSAAKGRKAKAVSIRKRVNRNRGGEVIDLDVSP